MENDMKFNVETFANSEQMQIRVDLAQKLRNTPIPDEELVKNLSLFVPWQEMMRTLFITELYQKIIEIPGVVMEFGTRWGRNLALFSTLRATLEPFNHNRKIVGFDTFHGLPEPSEKDGASDFAKPGSLAVAKNWKQSLEDIMHMHEKGLPYAHVKKFDLVEGDATVQLEKYLKDHPETIISLVYFDMDLYEPTKICLELIREHVTKGSVVAFDEVNHGSFPGETIALKEVMGLPNISLRRSKLNPLCGYFVVN
jgi:hypothetical protein